LAKYVPDKKGENIVDGNLERDVVLGFLTECIRVKDPGVDDELIYPAAALNFDINGRG
jgi:hypothetical protein